MFTLNKPAFFLYSAAILISIAIAFNWQLLSYALSQGIGQIQIVLNAQPIESVIQDRNTPDSIRNKLQFIQEVRTFAIDSLGLNPTENYTTYYDQQNKELMWVVTAAEPFALNEKNWSFPFIGTVPYKGFFSLDNAKQEARIWKNRGLDVSIRNPGGWSTLGWFRDPVLSGMLFRSEGDLASLIIHELAHATIYVKDSSTFNENLASFIGDEGAKKFLKSKYGANTPELEKFEQEGRDYRKWVQHVLRGAGRLDSLYRSTSFFGLNHSVRELHKQNQIRLIFQKTDTLDLSESFASARRRWNDPPNNTFFMSVIRYQARQTDFSRIFESEFTGDILQMIEFYRKNYPIL